MSRDLPLARKKVSHVRVCVSAALVALALSTCGCRAGGGKAEVDLAVCDGARIIDFFVQNDAGDKCRCRPGRLILRRSRRIAAHHGARHWRKKCRAQEISP